MRFRHISIALFFVGAYFLLYAVGAARPAFSLYNDDLGWLGALASQQGQTWRDVLNFTWTRHAEVGAPVLNFFLGAYFHFFGNTSHYLYPITLFAHTLGSFFLFLFLRELLPNRPKLSFAIGATYFLAFPHFHSYLWAISIQHLFFLVFHFGSLTLLLRALKKPAPYDIALFTCVFLVGSLGRTSFWFTMAAAIWLILFFEKGNRTERMRRFTPSLSLALLYPSIEAYDGTWGSQIERLATSFSWSVGAISVYRKLPLGWLFGWLALTATCSLLLPKLLRYFPRERTIRAMIVSAFILFLVTHAFYYREDLFYLVVAYWKYLLPSATELSPTVFMRWQPMAIVVHRSWEWVVLALCCFLAPWITWRTLKLYGVSAAVLFLPIVPSLCYLRTMGGGGFFPVESTTHYFIVSRYLVYFAPWVLLSLSSLISIHRGKKLFAPALALFLFWHTWTFAGRLERTALAETTSHFSSLFTESLRTSVAAESKNIEISKEGIESRVFDYAFTRHWKLDDDLTLQLFTFHLNREHPDRFHLSESTKAYRYCDEGWCDSNGKRLYPKTPLIEWISLRPGQSAESYLENVGAKTWEDWIELVWKNNDYGHLSKRMLLRQLTEMKALGTR